MHVFVILLVYSVVDWPKVLLTSGAKLRCKSSPVSWMILFMDQPVKSQQRTVDWSDCRKTSCSFYYLWVPELRLGKIHLLRNAWTWKLQKENASEQLEQRWTTFDNFSPICILQHGCSLDFSGKWPTEFRLPLKRFKTVIFQVCLAGFGVTSIRLHSTRSRMCGPSAAMLRGTLVCHRVRHLGILSTIWQPASTSNNNNYHDNTFHNNRLHNHDFHHDSHNHNKRFFRYGRLGTAGCCPRTPSASDWSSVYSKTRKLHKRSSATCSTSSFFSLLHNKP